MRRSPGFLLRALRVLLWSVLGTLLASALFGAWVYWRYVVHGPRLTAAEVRAVISEESPVTYRDGHTRIGVFFDREHRDYVSFDRIPRACVQALVDAEDDRFFEHPGFDWRGILRALLADLRAGRAVQGGSTLTQQLAKNLYYRPDRSLRRKLWELVAALRLERSFTKEQILEFYFNQFHVAGNGRGIGIAARYFFDRPVEDLDLQECAFMAGMVQGPARYDPWVGDEARREAARRRARERTAYVLRRMLEEGHIDEATYREALSRPLPFRRGTFRYGRPVVMDEVERLLASGPLAELLEERGLDRAGYNGLRIVTTLDPLVQRAARYALWHRLTELGLLLEEVEPGALVLPGSPRPGGPPGEEAARRQFRVARVLAEPRDPDAGIGLDLGDGLRGLLDRRALDRVADLLAWRRSGRPGARGGREGREELLAALGPGSAVRVSLRERGGDGGWLCDLEYRPELQGAVVVLDRGEVLALVGGNDDQGLDRAVHARRQFGSTWKPLLYLAALQLGWRADDELDNRRQLFPFERSWYAPRPDHEPHPRVSLAWAGTRSENLASIWLLYHLVDRLDAGQLAALARLVGLAPAEDEPREAYIQRVRDELGVIATREALPASAFEAARAELLAQPRLLVHPEDLPELRSLLYGQGVASARRRVESGSLGDPRHREELLAALSRNYLELSELGQRCREQARVLQDATFSGLLPSPERVSELWWDGSTLGCGAPPEGARRVADELEAFVFDPSLPPVAPEHLLVGGVLHLSTLDALSQRMEAFLAEHGEDDPWSLDLLLWQPDFRRLLGMRYLAWLASSLGVSEELPPVLSLPLGAVEVSLVEMASVYQAIATGDTWRFPGRSFREGPVPGLRVPEAVAAPRQPWSLLREIRDREGAVLYRSRRLARPGVDPAAARRVLDVLRNVVRWGTGRRAARAVLVGGTPWPLAGKTGTTNGFRNAAFFGLLPRPGREGASPAEALTVAVYVGYDDNRPMRGPGLRVAGSRGGLPVFAELARALAEAGWFGERAVPPDFPAPEGFRRLPVDPATGLPLEGTGLDPERPSILVWGGEGRPRRVRMVPSSRLEGLVEP